jgi:hypothetical protein
MPPRRRFCPKGHDTFEVGRDSSHRCRRCKLDAKTATRKRASEARRHEAEVPRPPIERWPPTGEQFEPELG